MVSKVTKVTLSTGNDVEKVLEHVNSYGKKRKACEITYRKYATKQEW